MPPDPAKLRDFAERYTAAWFGPVGLIASSQGHFDNADYQRQSGRGIQDR